MSWAFKTAISPRSAKEAVDASAADLASAAVAALGSLEAVFPRSA
jgi:hypothetical protein